MSLAAPEQRKRLKPAQVWSEICSYLKGSVEAVNMPTVSTLAHIVGVG